MRSNTYFERYVFACLKKRYGDKLKLKTKHLSQALKRIDKNGLREDYIEGLRNLFTKYINPTVIFEVEKEITVAIDKWEKFTVLFEEEADILRAVARSKGRRIISLSSRRLSSMNTKSHSKIKKRY